MLHHAALELTPQDLDRSLEMWRLIGFERVPEPEPLHGRYIWVERADTQIHLALTEAPVVPRTGHVAVVAECLDETVERLVEAGFEVTDKRELWGARRVAVDAPAGHRVELMESPPPRREAAQR